MFIFNSKFIVACGSREACPIQHFTWAVLESTSKFLMKLFVYMAIFGKQSKVHTLLYVFVCFAYFFRHLDPDVDGDINTPTYRNSVY